MSTLIIPTRGSGVLSQIGQQVATGTGSSSEGAVSVLRDGAASFHWLVPDENEDQHGELVWACVPETLAAWHVRNAASHPDVQGGARRVNHWSLGIETVNTIKTSDAYSDWQVAITAKIVRYCWSKYPNLKHIVSHAKLDPERRNDPGTHFPWTRFKNLVLASAPSPFAGMTEDVTPVSMAHNFADGPRTSERYVTAFNYEDNSPPYSDIVARGRHVDSQGNSHAEIGRNNFTHPSSVAVGPEAGLPHGSRVFIEGYGWFLAEDRTGSGLSHAPRFDVWTAGAKQAELAALTGSREVTVFGPNETVPTEWRARTAGPDWEWDEWTSEERLAELRSHSGWRGLWIEGDLRT
jgi:N-acetylmuramoyl-L-alanine amidase